MKKKVKISRKKIAKQLQKENRMLHEDIIGKAKELLQIRAKSVAEECPECGREAMIYWDVRRDGYQTYCPYCGWPMMLCSMCMDEDRSCDWNGKTGICYRMVEKLWKDLENVLFRKEKDGRLILEHEYVLRCGTRVIKAFQKGTEREEIWHWFDEMHPKGVAYLLNGVEKNEKHDSSSPESMMAVVVVNGVIAKVTQEDVDDIMSAALDSHFLQSWRSEVNVVGRYLGEYASEQISRGGELWFYDIEDESYYGLTLDKFQKGLEMYLTENNSIVNRNGTDVTLDVTMIDEVSADMIIQYALFGEIVYG